MIGPLLLAIRLALGAADPAVALARANQAYASGDYAAAASGYAGLLEQGHISADVYYDLGNALYRQDDVARAILAWRRAALLAPRDGDIRANIERARRDLADRVDVDAAGPGIFFWSEMLSTSEQGWGAAVCVGALGLLALARRFRPGLPVAIPAVLLGLPGLLLAASTWAGLHAAPGGVVLADEVQVRSAPGGGGVVVFTLHAGAELRVTGEVSGWRLVELPGDGQRRGWMPAGGLGLVDAAAPMPM